MTENGTPTNHASPYFISCLLAVMQSKRSAMTGATPRATRNAMEMQVPVPTPVDPTPPGGPTPPAPPIVPPDDPLLPDVHRQPSIDPPPEHPPTAPPTEPTPGGVPEPMRI